MPVTDTSLLDQGLVIMLIGMSVVFSFLVIMVLTVCGFAKLMPLFAKICPEPEPKEEGKIKKVIEQHDDIALVLATVKAYVKG